MNVMVTPLMGDHLFAIHLDTNAALFVPKRTTLPHRLTDFTWTISLPVLINPWCAGDGGDPGEAEEWGGEEVGGGQGPPGEDGAGEESTPGKVQKKWGVA
jgi:hypothetical protein